MPILQQTRLARAQEDRDEADTIRSSSIPTCAAPVIRTNERRVSLSLRTVTACLKCVAMFCCMYVGGAWFGQLAREREAKMPAPVRSTLATSNTRTLISTTPALESIMMVSVGAAAGTGTDSAPLRLASPTTIGRGKPALLRRTISNEAVQPSTPGTSTQSHPKGSSMEVASLVATDQKQDLRRANDFLARKQVAQACIEARLVAKRTPEDPAVWDFLGRCYMRLGQPQEAREYYRKYLSLAPNSKNAPFIRAIVEGGPQ
ncbi:MAG TPA: tetratricopeptide repeat protein [Polyangiaceae bacterium]